MSRDCTNCLFTAHKRTDSGDENPPFQLSRQKQRSGSASDCSNNDTSEDIAKVMRVKKHSPGGRQQYDSDAEPQRPTVPKQSCRKYHGLCSIARGK
mmetsp:Transcript_83569/g.162539  ORF Transcript_83569/g.162539 Transcript_83569/m.162539 type:complete len:96 (-) Transcript_83569:638-925(-)